MPRLASTSNLEKPLFNTHLDSQITAGLLTRAAEARAEKGAYLQLPQAPDSNCTTANPFVGLKTTLQGSLSYPLGTPTHWSPSLPNRFISRNGSDSNGDLNYRYHQQINNPGAAGVAAPAFYATTAPVALTPGHVHQLHERLCKDSNALKLGPSTWTTSEKHEILISDSVAPSPTTQRTAPVPFIDFLGVGAA